MIKHSIKKIVQGCAALVLCSISLTNSYAYSWQATLYGGVSWTDLNLGSLYISENETDTLHHNDQNDGTFGAGLSWQFNPASQQQFIGNLLVGLNYFHLNIEPDGVVWLYGVPQLDNYRYQLPLKTDRLLVNGQIELFPNWRFFQPFVEGGLGFAHIRSQYWEIPALNSGVVNGNLIFSSRNDDQFVYTLGAGVKKHFAQRWTLSVAYNFTDFGTIHAGPYDQNMAILRPLDIDVKLHTGLVGLSYEWA